MSNTNFRFYIHFVDDYSRYTWIYPLKAKSDALSAFTHFQTLAENLLDRKIKSLKSDGGGEYQAFNNHVAERGIDFQQSCPHTSAQNGRAERKHRHIVEMGLTLLAQAGIPQKYWWDAFQTSVYLINRLPTPVLKGKSPLEVLFGKKPDYKFLKTFGCTCYPCLRPYQSHKFQYHSTKCVNLGYSDRHKGYKCLSSTGRLYISRNVIFNEDEFPFLTGFLNTHQNEQTVHVSVPSWSTMLNIPLSSSQTPSVPSEPETPTPPADDSEEPPSAPQSTHNISQVHNSPSSLTSGEFEIAHEEEQEAAVDLVPENMPTDDHEDKLWHTRDGIGAMLMRREKCIGNKWVYKIKLNSDGSVERLKARLVAKGFNQRAGIDYSETFSPVVKASTIRIVLTIAVSKGWTIRQLDINNAFLNGKLEEKVYMQQPEGFIDPNKPNHVCLLNKSLYGLKQAPRAWFDKLKSTLASWKFMNSRADSSLFWYASPTDIVIVLIYVDDIIITGNDTIKLQQFVDKLNQAFALKDLGDLHYFLGIEVVRDETGIYLSQSKYIHELLKKTNMMHVKPCATPMTIGKMLSISDGELLENPTEYRSIIGALQYLTHTRPDLSFSVNKLSQFLKAPTTLPSGHQAKEF
uniref:Integrase catalytic domain-containing protein n=1 Tax=Cannabis sativa TaxID=3483 RepID=A0A803Q615_CANSA